MKFLLFLISSRESKYKVTSSRKRSEDVSSFAEEKQTVKTRPPWQMLTTADALPPRAMTVTSVSQNKELQVRMEPHPMRGKGVEKGEEEGGWGERGLLD